MKKIVFLGTPLFSVNVLGALLQKDYEIIAVVTQPDKRVGRRQVLTSSPVKEFALDHHLPILQPQKLSGSQEEAEIISKEPDLIITAAYGQFLSNKLLNSAKIASINFHASLLPKYRGAAPIQYALMNGDEITGITIMEMVSKMDAGDIFFQDKLNIAPDDDLDSLTFKLGELAADMARRDIPLIFEGKYQKVAQDQAAATFSPSIKAAEEELDFNDPVEKIFNKIRALSPKPGAFIFHQGKRIKIFKAKPLLETTKGDPGTVFLADKKRLGIITGDHKGLLITDLQVQGAKRLSIQAFRNGSGKEIKVGDNFVTEN